jgi:hypothetical protein
MIARWQMYYPVLNWHQSLSFCFCLIIIATNQLVVKNYFAFFCIFLQCPLPH